jgi:acyl-CoA reductase-like NAD-dependent aldehyde dehydrogenase
MAIRSINPSRPLDVLDEFNPAGPDEVRGAVERGQAAFRSWSQEPAIVRADALDRVADALAKDADELSRLMTREVGKPITEARAEVARAVAIWRYYGQLALGVDGETFPSADGRSWLMARRYPLGVCGLITPWNFPVAIPSWKAAPAVAYGNSVILKPASAATSTARLLAEIANRHLPEGVFHVAAGGADTAQALIQDPTVAAISFTGSVTVGRMIARQAAGRGVRFQCEMGGQNPSLVLADADLDRAASTIAYAAMGYAGQKCTATSRVIVEAPVFQETRDRVVAAIEGLQVTDPEDDGCQVGPLISDEARSEAMDAVQRGGGTVLTGGTPLPDEGFYLAPTLVEVGDPGSLLAQEEVFAPVAALLEADSAEAAVDLATMSDTGWWRRSSREISSEP